MSMKSNLSSAVYWYIQCTRYLHLINNWNWVAGINSSKNVVNRGHWNTTLDTVSTVATPGGQSVYILPPYTPPPPPHTQLYPHWLHLFWSLAASVAFLFLVPFKWGYYEGLLFPHFFCFWFWLRMQNNSGQLKSAETETPLESGPGLLAWPWRHLNPGTL